MSARRTKKRAKEDAAVKAARAAAVLRSDGLMRLPEVLAVFPVSASTWWAGVAAGKFPPSVKVGPRCTCWRARDVRALIERTGEVSP